MSLSAEKCCPGFSVVEVLVVVAVLGVLVAVAIPGYVEVKKHAREAEVKSGVHKLQVALEDFAMSNKGEYPRYLIGGAPGSPSNLSSDPLLREGYLGSYPANPFVSNPGQVVSLQVDAGDPLRPGKKQGERQGRRFGPGELMGNTAGGDRYRDSHLTYRVSTDSGEEVLSAYSNFCYLSVDECEVRPVTYLPGQFAYRPGYALAGFGGPRRTAGSSEDLNPVRELNCTEQGTGLEQGICSLRRTFPRFDGKGLVIATGPER